MPCRFIHTHIFLLRPHVFFFLSLFHVGRTHDFRTGLEKKKKKKLQYIMYKLTFLCFNRVVLVHGTNTSRLFSTCIHVCLPPPPLALPHCFWLADPTQNIEIKRCGLKYAQGMRLFPLSSPPSDCFVSW